MSLQVVSLVETLHAGLGSVLIFVHSLRVWLLPWPPKQAILARHCRPDCLPHRHHPPLLPSLPRWAHIPYDRQTHLHCSQVPLSSFLPIVIAI